MSDNQFFMNEDDDNDIDMTPMLDVVFIMLIFFIVTSTFVKEAGVDVTRPQADTAVQAEANSIQIGIDASNQVFMDKRQIDKRAIRANVERGLAESPGAAVIIVADRDSNTDTLIQVMDQARLAGAESVSVASENN
ncbi:biopolymer transporter ExbD [Marinimicrobium sp. C6131]|uniref:ExbD/TolR family protein n=1 Tax=Marinimicrobium sp. C6131 TaxID=3022676 RepID=UPI00223D25FE|nr:biopolymer transporter ExbD [Marinimicrobium sp. C6131]UZJ44053.1 biopolymer transporter ExbD [Marinimicrobium sp. C6131]